MKNILVLARGVISLAISMILLASLAACGGGGGSPGARASAGSVGGSTGGTTGGTTGANGGITLTLTDTSGAATQTLTGAGTLIAKAVVTTSTGAPAANVVVTFSLSGTIATLSPASGTALTDATGTAQIGLKSSNTGVGAVELTAKATPGTAEVSTKVAFAVGASASAVPAAINFVSAVPSDKSIVIKGSGGNGRTEVALLTFNVVDSANSGVPNVDVSFTPQSSQPVTLTATTGKTDANGSVTVAVNSGTAPTTVRVIATVNGTAISAISDTVTVTTGQPVQTAFSLAVEKFYVEGLNQDNVTNKLTALLADQFGGAVADGTQVVFTTDGGAIVGDGGAMCLTSQGGCSVTWRSQKPHTSDGIVTVVATATNATGNLSTSTRFYSSGSFAKVTLASSNATQAANGTISLDFLASCTPVTLKVKVADINGNPMPETTTIAAQNPSQGSVTINPPTVKYTGADITADTGGTTHDVVITPATSCTGSGTAQPGAFDLSVKSPLGSETLTHVAFTFKAP